MKNLILLCLVMIGLIGCGVSRPIISQMPNNQYQISLQGGIGMLRETLIEEWNKVAAQKCSNFDVVTQQYLTNPDGVDSITGIIKCK